MAQAAPGGVDRAISVPVGARLRADVGRLAEMREQLATVRRIAWSTATGRWSRVNCRSQVFGPSAASSEA